MTILTVSLDDVSTSADLAQKLNVPHAAINLINIVSKPRKRASCPLPSCLFNYGCCILCSQTWYPHNRKGPSNLARGHGLYGPQYMREYNNVVKPGVCCCDNPTCLKIGYSHEGMFTLPYSDKKGNKLTTTLQCLGVSEATKSHILNNPGSIG
eukprot:scaffold37867_cov65-Cyclotella_meneghiniana.AAC.3